MALSRPKTNAKGQTVTANLKLKNNNMNMDNDHSDITEINSDELDEKSERIEKEKQELLNKVLSGNLQTKHDQVGFILNNFIEARNSDIELAWVFWKTFESDKFNGIYVYITYFLLFIIK